MRLNVFTRRFMNGRCPVGQLPATISLSGIRRVMKRLWQASIRDMAAGVVVEHAATLVQRADGKVRLNYVVAGTAGEVDAIWTVAPDETAIGTYHTRPYEGGLTGMAFSEADFVSAIVMGEWISLVQSGDEVFALVCTDQTVDDIVPMVLEAEFDETYEAGLRSGMSEPEAVWAANLEVCALYGLAFYAGWIDEDLEVTFAP